MSYSSEVLADSPQAYWRLGDRPVVAQTASSTFSATFAASKAFDNDNTTSWTTNATATGWLQIQYGTAFAATSYTLTGRRDATPTRSPKDWTFQGSNNGTTWTTLDTRAGVTDWASQTDARTYTFTNSTAYAYYRLNVTANNGDTYLNVTELAVPVSPVLAADETGVHPATFANSPTLGVAGALVGDSNTAATFASASSQQATAAFWTALNSSSFTLECWVKTTAAGQAIMGRGGGTPAPYSMFVDSAGKLQFVIKTNSAGTSGSTYSGTATINNGAWHHLVIVRDNAANAAYLYVDGALDTTISAPDLPFISGSSGFLIASRGLVSYFDGTIDEVAYYNAALSASRVVAHYAAGTGGGPATVAGGQASSTNTALAGVVSAGARVAGGMVSSSNVALAGVVLAGVVVAGGVAVEADTARAGSAATGEIIAGGLAVEADAGRAGSVAAGAVVTGGQVLETDTGLAGTAVLSSTHTVIGGTAYETSYARRGTVVLPWATTDRTNRVNGLTVTGSLPLAFTPAVDPAPVLRSRKRVIAATAFAALPDTTGTTASYATTTRHKARLRERYVIGGKDATYVFGAPTELTWQLVSPLLYGPATAKFPGIKTPFRQVGKGTLRWLRKGATVKVQLVDEDDHIVDTVYRGLVTAWAIDGTDISVQIGGEASGRAAMRRKPLPVYSTNAPVGRLAYNLIRDLGLDFKPFLGPDTPNTVIPRLGGMWQIEAIEYLCKISQRRDGTQYSIMPGANGAYRFEPKDRTTVHATVYVDGTRVAANVRSDMAEEHNRVFVNSVTPEGRRLTGIVAPGIIQGDPPPWSGSPLSEGDSGGLVPVLINKLRATSLLDRGEGEGFDADVTEAVQDLQEMAGLPETGVVDQATWNALFDLDVTGYSLKWSRREPVAEQSRVSRWRTTADGAPIGRNPNYEPHRPKVDAELDLGAHIPARVRRRVGRSTLHDANADNWVGTIEVPMGAVIAGNHHFGDPFTLDDLMDFRLLKPGMNIMARGFQDDAGTLFHITGVDVASNTLQVDTRARDTLEVADVIKRNRDERMWRRGRRASIEQKDVVGEWDGAAGGMLGSDVECLGGQWTVFGVPAGDEGTISRIVLSTTPGAEFVAAVFGGNIKPNALADGLERVMGDPLTQAGYANWDDRDKRAWLKKRNLLYMAGSPDDPGGYEPRRKSNGGTLTGEFEDYAGAAYRTSHFPVLYVAVWTDRDTTIPAGRVMWNQLEPGA